MIPRELPFRHIEPMFPQIEILGFLIIIVCSFLIYYKTKEFYELSNHKGIKFFRKAFLYFGIAQIFGLLSYISHFYFFGPEEILEGRDIIPFLLLSNLIGVFYLYASLYSKKIKHEWPWIFGIFVIVILSLIIDFRLVFALMTILFIILGILSYHRYSENKKKKHQFSQIYLIYMLLMLYWITQTMGARVMFTLGLAKETIVMIGAAIFVYITFRVMSKLRLK